MTLQKALHQAVKEGYPLCAPPGSRTILVAEDEPGLRSLLCDIMRLYGHTVLLAGDGRTAVNLALEHRYPIDLVITNVIMPGLTGPQTVAKVTTIHPGAKALFISAYKQQELEEKMLIPPNVSFLRKPFSIEDLSQQARELLAA